MNQGAALQPQAKMPLKFLQVLNQTFMHEATIRKQRDPMSFRQNGTQLVEHRLIGFKTDLGALVAHGSPRQRDGAATIHEAGTDQHEGRESGRRKARWRGADQLASQREPLAREADTSQAEK